MSEEKPEYLTEAEEMLGKGYESVRIEPERSVIRRVNGKMESYDLPAFVKISTSFKSELAEISGDALKVWLFIALSINRKTGKANPGLRTISENVKLAVNTVQKCLQELENLNLLTVDRQSRKFNIYETHEYVSANRAEPTVSNRDTDAETVSNLDTTVSNFAETVSPSVILNQSNQKNQTNSIPQNMPIDWYIQHGLPIPANLTEQAQIEASATGEFESAFGFGQLPWDSTATWQKFKNWTVKVYRANNQVFRQYVAWRNGKGKYEAMSNKQIRMTPQAFMDTGYPAFEAHSTMYTETEEKVRLL